MTKESVEKKKLRLDLLLVERGLYESRNKAAAALMAGEVYVGKARDRQCKPGQRVSSDIELELRSKPKYVTRAGEKLENALNCLSVATEAKDCLDVGAAHGGFTHCLLKRGAARVTTVDVGSEGLSWELANDPRIFELPSTNARELGVENLPYRPDIITVDVSFISIKKVLPAVLACAKERFDCLAMVKPQFEVGKHQVGRGGVIRDPEQRFQAVLSVAQSIESLGYAVKGFASSGLPGPKGNRETFVHIVDLASAVDFDLESSLKRVEI